MGSCVEKLPHTCGGTRSLQVFAKEDGTYDGYCFRCNTHVKDPYGDGQKPKATMRIKTPEQIKEELDEINSLSAQDLPERKLTQRVLDYYGVKVALSEADGVTPACRFYPYRQGSEVTGFKAKTNTKQMYTVGNTKGCDMFGWEQAMRYGNKFNLFITEGEDDAMALFRALKQNWTVGGEPAVVSLRTGSMGAVRDIEHHRKDIERVFKNVVLVFDNDEPGQKAVQQVSKLLPGVHVAKLPLKDANDMLIAGRQDELVKAVLFERTSKISGNSYRASELRERAKEKIAVGLPWPWEAMTEVTRGRRRGEVYYFGAGVKMGKSVVVDTIAAHCVLTQDTPIWLCKPEEPMVGTVQRIAGKVMRKVFWDPKMPYEEADLDEGIDIIGEKVIIYDAYQGTDWEVVKAEIRAAVMVAGVKDIFLDPLTCFTVGMSLTEQNETLISIASEIAAMAMELDFTAYLFCHLNAPQSGVPHERGGKVQSVQFSGSRAMMRQRRM